MAKILSSVQILVCPQAFEVGGMAVEDSKIIMMNNPDENLFLNLQISYELQENYTLAVSLPWPKVSPCKFWGENINVRGSYWRKDFYCGYRKILSFLRRRY